MAFVGCVCIRCLCLCGVWEVFLVWVVEGGSLLGVYSLYWVELSVMKSGWCVGGRLVCVWKWWDWGFGKGGWWRFLWGGRLSGDLCGLGGCRGWQ